MTRNAGVVISGDVLNSKYLLNLSKDNADARNGS